MWTKDIYEEQVLAYLDEVEADFEQMARAHLQHQSAHRVTLIHSQPV